MHTDWLNSKIFRAISMAIVFLSSVAISVYITSIATHIESSAEEEALANAPVITEAAETQPEAQSETEIQTETAASTEPASTEKLKANTNVHTVLASGDKKKDEDKGNDKVIDSSLQGENIISGDNKIPEHNLTPPPKPTPEPETPNPQNPNLPKRTKFYYVDAANVSGWQSYGGDLFYIDETTHQPLKGLQGFDPNPNDKFPGFYYYFNEHGAKASVLGIDVSHHNGKINWNKVKAEGIDYAIIRVGFRGYGTSDKVKPVMIDKRVEENIRGAKSVGIPIGLYFYSQAISVAEALEEAGACVNIANRYGIQYPIYFDTEFATSGRTGRADRLSRKARTDYAVAFCEAVKNAGYTPGVYASKTFFYDELDFSRLRNYEIWVAHYTNRKTGTDFKYPYESWQYADDGVVNGSSRYTDVNISYYDYKKRSNMRQNGKNVIFTDTSSVQQFHAAEAAFDKYTETAVNEDYEIANELIAKLSNAEVRQTMQRELDKTKAYFDAQEKETESQAEQQAEAQIERIAKLPLSTAVRKIKEI